MSTGVATIRSGPSWWRRSRNRASPRSLLYSEITDVEAWDRLWASEIHDKWGEVMNPLMEFGDDGKVDSTEVREVFHIETIAGLDEDDLAADEQHGLPELGQLPADDPRMIGGLG